MKHRRRVEWAPEAALQLEEACVDRKRGSRTVVGTMRFFRGDHVGARRCVGRIMCVSVCVRVCVCEFDLVVALRSVDMVFQTRNWCRSHTELVSILL